jgi:hypothetical protein
VRGILVGMPRVASFMATRRRQAPLRLLLSTDSGDRGNYYQALRLFQPTWHSAEVVDKDDI